MVCTKLHEAATCFLHKQFVDIITSDEFLSLGKEEVMEIIGSDELNVPREEQVRTMAYSRLQNKDFEGPPFSRSF